jgi:hypothetical protein
VQALVGASGRQVTEDGGRYRECARCQKIALYAKAFGELAQQAAYGQAARKMIEAALAELRDA